MHEQLASVKFHVLKQIKTLSVQALSLVWVNSKRTWAKLAVLDVSYEFNPM